MDTDDQHLERAFVRIYAPLPLRAEQDITPELCVSSRVAGKPPNPSPAPTAHIQCTACHTPVIRHAWPGASKPRPYHLACWERHCSRMLDDPAAIPGPGAGAARKSMTRPFRSQLHLRLGFVYLRRGPIFNENLLSI